MFNFAMTQLPFVPYLHSAEDVVFFFYIMTRVGGLFLAAPLLSNPNIPKRVKATLVFMITVLLSMVMYEDYRGENPRYIIDKYGEDMQFYPLFIFLILVKEFAIGFMIGFCFVLLFEAILFAGQISSHMVGFSMAQLLDPVSGSSQTILAQLFALAATLIILLTELHHSFLIILMDSFTVLPIGDYHLPYASFQHVVHGSARVFHYGLNFAAIPYVILVLVTIGLGFMAKIMPEMNIFMVGFPLKILVGYYGLVMAIGYFPLLLRQAFVEYENLARILISQFAGL
ncbi:Flagellar biosynthetic protein FliR [Chlamydiales bacterium SCGC AG-110-M15]|nr:Flagellar biosynthetic protein FliR [Chlamydiales bacterium SCGC AG-110-M15]